MATEQKVSVVVLGICGVLAIGLSLYNLRLSVMSPFLAKKSEMTAAKKIIGLTQEEEIAKQQRMDTDGDSLSDWDEVNIYHTNPNLRDSCGDGRADNIRVVSGKNLNCAGKAATGQLDVSGVGSIAPTMGGTQQQTTDNLLSMFATGTEAEASPVEPALARDPAAIRAALKGKVDQTKLNQLSDTQLLEYYDTALAEQKKLQAEAATGTATQ
ncbi:MAG: thrombospondin type 3 repeat-containing protein [Patescibacteria group bacterium]